jgi:hypothetical protein
VGLSPATFFRPSRPSSVRPSVRGARTRTRRSVPPLARSLARSIPRALCRGSIVTKIMTILYSKPSVSRLRLCYRVVAAATIAVVVVVVGSSWFTTNFCRIPCGDHQEKAWMNFPLCKPIHEMKWVGWLDGCFFCLLCFTMRKYNDPLYLFHNAKIYYKTKHWNIKLVSTIFLLQSFPCILSCFGFGLGLGFGFAAEMKLLVRCRVLWGGY